MQLPRPRRPSSGTLVLLLVLSLLLLETHVLAFRPLPLLLHRQRHRHPPPNYHHYHHYQHNQHQHQHRRARSSITMDAGGSFSGWPPYHGENEESGGEGLSGFGPASSSSGSSSSSSSSGSSSDTSSSPPPASSSSSGAMLPPPYPPSIDFPPDPESSSITTSTSSQSIRTATTGRVPWIEGRPSKSNSKKVRQPRGSSRKEGSGSGGGKSQKGPTKFRGVRTILSETDEQGRFVRSPSVHRNWIGPDSKFRAQPNRYHLYVSLACPWSCRCLMVLYLKGLDNVISISVVHPTWYRTKVNDEMDHHAGWVFRTPKDPPLPSPSGWGKFDCEGCIHDYVNGARTVRELYDMARDTDGKYSVPVLWDKRTSTIVNNESGDIMRMLNSAFNDLAMNPHLDLRPLELAKAVDQYATWLHETINDGVYRCGLATSQPAYEEALDTLFSAMDHAEALLGRQRYLLGDRLTEADIRLFQTLVRFDEVYHPHFKCNRKQVLTDYPNLLNYSRELFQMPGVALSVNMKHIKTHYYSSHPTLNHFALIPAGPRFLNELYKPHDRERFPRRRVGLW